MILCVSVSSVVISPFSFLILLIWFFSLCFLMSMANGLSAKPHFSLVVKALQVLWPLTIPSPEQLSWDLSSWLWPWEPPAKASPPICVSASSSSLLPSQALEPSLCFFLLKNLSTSLFKLNMVPLGPPYRETPPKLVQPGLGSRLCVCVWTTEKWALDTPMEHNMPSRVPDQAFKLRMFTHLLLDLKGVKMPQRHDPHHLSTLQILP